MQEPKKMVNVAVKASALLVVASFTFCAGKVSNKLIMEARNPRWEAMWSAGIAPGQAFDAGISSPALLQMLKEDKIPYGRALVPGCGRGYDVVALANSRRNTLDSRKVEYAADSIGGISIMAFSISSNNVGIEISQVAIDAARNRLATLPSSHQPPQGSAEFQLASFFEMPSDTEDAKFDFIYDYTFLCALDPSMRKAWASKMSDLVKPGGELFTLIFPISEEREGGPPFRVSLQIVRDLLEPAGFEAFQLELLPSELCHPGRDGISGPYASGIGRWKRII